MTGPVAGAPKERESWRGELESMGASPEAVKQLGDLFHQHKGGGEIQTAADKEIGEAANSDTPLGEAIRRQVSLEEAIFEHWENVAKNELADRREAAAKKELKWEWDNGMGNKDAYDDMEHQWRVEHQYKYDQMREPTVFYRKGGFDKDVVPTSLNSSGAQSHSVTGSAQPHFEPTHKFTAQEMRDAGYRILGGYGYNQMGYSGESEVTWVKIGKSKSEDSSLNKLVRDTAFISARAKRRTQIHLHL
jgi:hypothetical protein